MLQSFRKLQRVLPAAQRHLLGRNTRPYGRILATVCAQSDIWVTTQGNYMAWWREREAAHLTVSVEDGKGRVTVSSPRAVIECVGDDPARHDFLEGDAFACPASTFNGECLLTIDRDVHHKATLVEILRREGILNYRIARVHPGAPPAFLLTSAELDPLLAQVHARLLARADQPDPDDVCAIRELVRQKFAARGLPLLRVWYHPRVQGRVPLAVFSPRYDVDRAITNLARIRTLEQQHGVESTFYVRAFCPFYDATAVADLSAAAWCPEIALHGEFVTTSRVLGSEARAAVAERLHLERTIGADVRGVGMHGGELTSNLTDATSAAQHAAKLQYDTTPRPRPGNYLPFRRIINGTFSNVFALPHALSDVNIAADWRYGERFYAETIAMMEQIRAANGVFVLMMHPEYFGFFAYLLQPANRRALLRYLHAYLRGSGRASLQPAQLAAQEFALE